MREGVEDGEGNAEVENRETNTQMLLYKMPELDEVHFLKGGNDIGYPDPFSPWLEAY
jgi:hypothetical protein